MAHVRTALHQITRVILELVNVDVEMDADAAVDGDVTTAEDDSVKYVNV